MVSFKSIAAYRGGLNIDPLVSKQDVEEGLQRCLKCILLFDPVNVDEELKSVFNK